MLQGSLRLILLNAGVIIPLLVENIGLLRTAFHDVKKSRPFDIDAAVVMPDLHCLLTFPPGDSDYSTRWGQIKGHFSQHIDTGERVSKSRAKRRERGLWQRRFWAHLITDQDDFNRHADYISIGIRLSMAGYATWRTGPIRVFVSLYDWASIRILGDIRANLILMLVSNPLMRLLSSAHLIVLAIGGLIVAVLRLTP